jgi:uracil-DNA glycosylase family 4
MEPHRAILAPGRLGARTIGRMAHSDPVAAAADARDIAALDAAIAGCDACPRLVAWREEQARVKVARFREEPYWGRAVPGFGDPRARIVLVGLAPAAHGANRTGRVFTGDASGDFLWRSLHAVGLASQPVGRRADDGLRLDGVRVLAAVRCAPPANRPTPEERTRCRPYLAREIELLDDARVIVALGAIGWDAILGALAAVGLAVPRPGPRFAHGAEVSIGRHSVLGTYHPSQQNTFTGRLTAPMLETVLRRAVALAEHTH